MKYYSLGFTIDYDAIRLVVARKKRNKWEILRFLQANFEINASEPSEMVFPGHDPLLNALLELYESPDLEFYRMEMEKNIAKSDVAIGISSDLSWIRYIPFSSSNDLYNPARYQRAVEENLRTNIPYPADLLVYDAQPVDVAQHPHVYLLVCPKKIRDEILGSKEHDSIWEQAGFPAPKWLLSQNQACLTLYHTNIASRRRTSLLIRLQEKYLEMSILEGVRPCKTETLYIPNFPSQDPVTRKIMLAMFVFVNTKMSLMYDLQGGNTVNQLVLLGNHSFISLNEMQLFLRTMLAKTISEVDFNKLRTIFEHPQLESILQSCVEPFKLDFSTPIARSPIDGRPEKLCDYIYEKMLEQENDVMIDVLDPHFLEQFLADSARKQITDTQLNEMVVPFGIALYPLLKPGSYPNIAAPWRRVKSSGSEQLLRNYFPQTVLNILVMLMLIYVAVTFFRYRSAEQQIRTLRTNQYRELTNIENLVIELDKKNDIEWHRLNWRNLDIQNVGVAESFPTLRNRKTRWSSLLRELADALPPSTIVTSLSLEIAFDGASGKQVALVTIRGYASKVAQVIEELSAKTPSLHDIRLESPVEIQNDNEYFVLVGKYLP